MQQVYQSTQDCVFGDEIQRDLTPASFHSSFTNLATKAEITCLGDPKYLARLDKLINSTETAKHAQSLRMEHEGLGSSKEPGRKSASSSEEVRTIVYLSSVVYRP